MSIKYEKEQPKMTREETVKLLSTTPASSVDNAELVDKLCALGLIKFDEPEKPLGVVNIHRFDNKYGDVWIEELIEGLVLWVGGKIVWKSWEKYYRKGNAVTIEHYDCHGGKEQCAGIIK